MKKTNFYKKSIIGILFASVFNIHGGIEDLKEVKQAQVFESCGGTQGYSCFFRNFCELSPGNKNDITKEELAADLIYSIREIACANLQTLQKNLKIYLEIASSNYKVSNVKRYVFNVLLSDVRMIFINIRNQASKIFKPNWYKTEEPFKFLTFKEKTRIGNIQKLIHSNYMVKEGSELKKKVMVLLSKNKSNFKKYFDSMNTSLGSKSSKSENPSLPEDSLTRISPDSIQEILNFVEEISDMILDTMPTKDEILFSFNKITEEEYKKIVEKQKKLSEEKQKNLEDRKQKLKARQEKREKERQK